MPISIFLSRALIETNNKYQVNFLFEDDADWGTFGGCKLNESNLELNLGGIICVVRPKSFETVYVHKKPDLSFMRLKYKGLSPSGIYTPKELGEDQHEDVLEIGKEFYHIMHWEEKSMGEDENGNPIPLPNNARPWSEN